jgi:hypothetical protein
MFCGYYGYKDAGVGLLLTVGLNTLVPCALVLVAGGTLGSSSAPTLGAMALEGGRVGLIMTHKSRIAVLQVASLLADVGMVFCSVWSTLRATKTVRSAVEIVGIAQCLGLKCHVSLCRPNN